jgi:hypothetical protein
VRACLWVCGGVGRGGRARSSWRVHQERRKHDPPLFRLPPKISCASSPPSSPHPTPPHPHHHTQQGVNYWGQLLPEEEGGESGVTGAEALFLTASFQDRLVLGARVPMQGMGLA